jgi:hypothetical protein
MANGAFNRGSNNAGRKRDGSRLPGQSASEGNVGNVIPRPTTIASIRRAQSLMNILNDKQSGGNTFSRGTTKGGVRRNFSMMAQMSLAGGGDPFSVQVIAGPETRPAASGADGLVSFDSAVYDPDTMWSPPEKIICRSAGAYSCDYRIVIDPWPADLTIELQKNGSTVDFDVFSAGTTVLTGTYSIALALLDEIALNIVDPASISADFEIISVEFTVAKT